MNTYCFVPIGHTADEIIIHAANRESAMTKLTEYVNDVRQWRISNG